MDGKGKGNYKVILWHHTMKRCKWVEV